MLKQNSSNRFLLLYGSQTGQAEAISEELRDRARALGLNPDFQCMKGVDKTFNLERESLAVIVISTTGDGEPPETARKLIRRLKKRTLTKVFLQNLSYCLLALGDSNYLNFCVCGKQFDKRLRELGAQPFQETSHADDAIGLEVVADPWLDRTLEYLANYFNIKMGPSPSDKLTLTSDPNSCITLQHSSVLKDAELNVPSMPSRYINIDFQPESELQPKSVLLQNISFPSAATEVFFAKNIESRKLTESPLVKEYIQVTFQLLDNAIEYEPGDSFGFLPENDPDEVVSILNKLGILAKADEPCSLKAQENSTIPNHLPTRATPRFYLTACCDITLPPKKTLLRCMAEHATDAKEKRRLLELCSRQGSTEFTKLIRSDRLSLSDLLNAFPSCHPTPFSAFLENLPRLQPRYYSVASSPLSDLHIFSAVFSVITYKVGLEKDRERNGICTGYLKKNVESWLKRNSQDHQNNSVENLAKDINELDLDGSRDFLIFKRKSSNFLLPEDHRLPLIMIGPGAGVAPFLSFLKHRQELHKNGQVDLGESWLYFGCRYCEHDFLFEKELKTFVSDGILSHLRLSFSRDGESTSKYVQDNIRQDFADLLNLIDLHNATVFVCGDAKNMSKDVAKTFVEGYANVKNVSTKEAERWLSDLQKSIRYIQDLWL